MRSIKDDMLGATAMRVALTALLLQRGCPVDRLDSAYSVLGNAPVPMAMSDIVREVEIAIADTQGGDFPAFVLENLGRETENSLGIYPNIPDH